MLYYQGLRNIVVFDMTLANFLSPLESRLRSDTSGIEKIETKKLYKKRALIRYEYFSLLV